MSPRGRHRTTDPYDHDKNDSSFVDFPTTCEAIDNCTIPIDVVLASAEGRLFGAHSKNLELCTDGFPLAGSTTKSDSPEIVPLSDKGDTLLLFLKFIHNHPPPNLIDLDTDGLLDLAKVLDKYGSYIPLAMCRQQMKIRSENSVEDALKVLRFKITICDLEGIDAIARRTFQFSAVSMLETVFDEDHLREFAVWVKYQADYEKLKIDYRKALNNSPSGTGATTSHRCSAKTFAEKLRPIADRVPCSLDNFNMAVDMVTKYHLEPCSFCKAFNNWCTEVRWVLQTSPTWTDYTLGRKFA